MSGIQATVEYPGHWPTEQPLLASRRWAQAMSGRIEGKPLWLSIHRGGTTDVGFAARAPRAGITRARHDR